MSTPINESLNKGINQVTTPNLDTFFSGGGGKSVSWKGRDIGYSVSGTIIEIDPPRQQTDPVSGKPQFKKDGITPKTSVRIGLATKDRDPSDEEDDGTRSLWVQGWMQGAVGDALRKAGRNGPPEVGGHLTVTLVERTPPDNPALSPTNKFSAVYVSPTASATNEFFSAGPVPAANPATVAADEPARPDGISEAAWSQMPLDTKRNLAATMADVPPY